jgi:predicted dithiol-disulfide oxidoreductase (DUF899 family)
MDTPKIVSRQEWLKARKAFLAKEKAFTKERDRLTAARRALPLVEITKDYRFQTASGDQGLADLFGPHIQLIIQHFMFGPDWEEGCPSCSFWADNFNGIDAHLAARDTAFAAVSNASLEKLLAYRNRLGWTFNWASAAGSTFSADFGVSFHDGDGPDGQGYNYTGKVFGEEMPGVSVFLRLPDGTLCHSYSTYARGLDMLNAAYHLLDLTPKGRDEDNLDFTMAWIRRRDRYA